MRNRLRKAREACVRALLAVWSALLAVWSFVTGIVGWDELAIGVGLALVAFGLWEFWRPGAYIVPGLVILYMAVPPRPAFITRPPAIVKRVRKD